MDGGEAQGAGRADDGVEERRVTVGGGRGGDRDGSGRRARWRALLGVLVLGSAAGGGAVLGLAVALAWALPGRLSGDRPEVSVAGLLLVGALGALLGAVLCTLVAGLLVAAVSGFRRPARRDPNPSDGTGSDGTGSDGTAQKRSS